MEGAVMHHKVSYSIQRNTHQQRLFFACEVEPVGQEFLQQRPIARTCLVKTESAFIKELQFLIRDLGEVELERVDEQRVDEERLDYNCCWDNSRNCPELQNNYQIYPRIIK